MMVAKSFFLFTVLVVDCFMFLRFVDSKLPQEEVDALQQITKTLGAVYWQFNSDSCAVEMFGITEKPPRGSDSRIVCDCNLENNTICHVIKMYNPLSYFLMFGIMPVAFKLLFTYFAHFLFKIP